MKPFFLVSMALAGLFYATSVSAVSAVFKRDPNVKNLYLLAVDSFSDQESKDAFAKTIFALWRPNRPQLIGLNPYRVIISEYVSRLSNYLSKGLDEMAADALTTLSMSGNNSDHPIPKDQLDDFIHQVMMQLEENREAGTGKNTGPK